MLEGKRVVVALKLLSPRTRRIRGTGCTAKGDLYCKEFR